MPASHRPRLPLLGIALCAVAGILLADRFQPPPLAAAAVAIVGLMAAAGRGGTFALGLSAAATFAAVHVWQWQDSPARAWADAVAPGHVSVTGVLIDEPSPAGGSWRARLRTEQWAVGDRTVPLQQTILVRWRSEIPPVYGQRWSITGSLERPRPPRNPAAFDAATWLARHGIFLELRSLEPRDALLLDAGDGSPIKSAAINARDWILRTISLGLEGDDSIRSLIAGISLGTRDDSMDVFEPAFRQTGTLHLFSVSGLHVGMFALLLWLVLSTLGLDRRRAILVIIPLVFFYSLVTGAQPSSLRAATMISLALGGFLLDRPASAANSLAAAALVLLGFDTNQLFQPGFQLSFCVVASILLLAPPLDLMLKERLRPDPFLPRKLYTWWQHRQAGAGRATAATLAVSTAAWIGGLPLTIWLFHLVPVYSVPANMFAVPLSFAILAVAMLSMTTGLISAWVATIFNQTNWALASLLLSGVQWAAALPGAWFYLPPGWMQPPACLTVFDLSTGGAQLLRTREQAWLIDAGTNYDFVRIVEPALRAAGVGRLDGLVLTHGDNEHLGGAASAIASTLPRRVFDSVLRDRSPARKNVHSLLRDANQPKTLVLPGDLVRVGPGTSLHILSPSPTAKSRVADDQAVVTRIDVPGFRSLLMSDSGVAAENLLLERPPGELSADILVLGRHGDDVFASSTFLAAVRPRVIILAPPDPFRDNFDEPALRQRLAATGAKIFDQAECGAVVTTFRPEAAEVRGFLGGQTITLEPLP
jgi:competence protein ComEC